MDSLVRTLRQARIIHQLNGGNYNAALEMCHNHLQEDIYDFEVRVRLVQSLNRKGLTEEADNELMYFDNSYESLAWKIVALFELGYEKEAKNAFDDCINLNKRDPLAYENMGESLFDLGKFEKAANCLEKAIIFKKYDSKLNIRNTLALCKRKLHEYDKAIELLDLNIEEDKNHLLSYTNKALILVDCKKYSEAANICKFVLKLDNQNHHALYVLEKIEKIKSDRSS
jgi:tetratricopeptide (TPR) repeat protein